MPVNNLRTTSEKFRSAKGWNSPRNDAAFLRSVFFRREPENLFVTVIFDAKC